MRKNKCHSKYCRGDGVVHYLSPINGKSKYLCGDHSKTLGYEQSKLKVISKQKKRCRHSGTCSKENIEQYFHCYNCEVEFIIKDGKELYDIFHQELKPFYKTLTNEETSDV